MGLVTIFGQAFLLALSGAVAPGPLLTYNIQLVYKNGFWAGPLIMVGHALLEAGLIIACILGLGGYFKLALVRIFLGFLGGLLLTWMGWELCWVEARQGIKDRTETAATGGGASITNFHPIMAGIVISLSNPYWLLWWVIAGMALLTKAFTLGWTGVAVFYLGHIAGDFGWYTLVSYLVAKGKRFLSGHYYRWLLAICGVFLMALAVMFIYDALRLIGQTQLFEKTIDLFKHFGKLV